jgi:hypothetical protein
VDHLRDYPRGKGHFVQLALDSDTLIAVTATSWMLSTVPKQIAVRFITLEATPIGPPKDHPWRTLPSLASGGRKIIPTTDEYIWFHVIRSSQLKVLATAVEPTARTGI